MSFFPITLFLFSFFIHKLCVEKEISPWAYLGGFITGFFVIMGITFVACLLLYGPNLMHDPDAQKKIETMTPFALLFQFLLFVFFRRRIDNIPFPDEDDDNNLPPNDGNGKKDLSYFR